MKTRSTLRSFLSASLFTSIALVPIAAQDGAPPAAKRRPWMDAPAEQKARWEQQKAAMKILDLSQETNRQVFIARGTPEDYHAHPTTAMLADNRTIIAVWNLGHGGHAGPMARSEDGGLTKWQTGSRIDS